MNGPCIDPNACWLCHCLLKDEVACSAACAAEPDITAAECAGYIALLTPRYYDMDKMQHIVPWYSTTCKQQASATPQVGHVVCLKSSTILQTLQSSEQTVPK